MPEYLQRRAEEHRRPALRRRLLPEQAQRQASWTRSTPARAARLTKSWAKAGPFRSACHACCPRTETVAALQSLWRYNFTPDVGPYRQAYKAGPLVCHAGRGRLADVHVPAPGLGLRASQRQRAGLGGRLLQRVHERLRVSGRRTHALGRHDDRGPALGKLRTQSLGNLSGNISLYG